MGQETFWLGDGGLHKRPYDQMVEIFDIVKDPNIKNYKKIRAQIQKHLDDGKEDMSEVTHDEVQEILDALPQNLRDQYSKLGKKRMSHNENVKSRHEIIEKAYKKNKTIIKKANEDQIKVLKQAARVMMTSADPESRSLTSEIVKFQEKRIAEWKRTKPADGIVDFSKKGNISIISKMNSQDQMKYFGL